MKFLSIIIPFYNCEVFINDCLESCVSQDILMDEYEIICVDDCSNDNGYEIIKEWAHKYNNIKYVKNTKNMGVSFSRNKGIHLSSSEYCLFLDGDDFLAHNCLKRLKQIIIDDNVDILSCSQLSFNEIGEIKINNIKNSYKRCEDDSIYLTNKIIRKSLIADILFLEDVSYGEDELFLFEIKQKNPKTINSNEPFYYYRIHKNSAMSLNTNKKRLKRIDSLIISADYLLKNYYPYKEQTINFIRERIINVYNDIMLIEYEKRKEKINMLKRYKLDRIKLNDGVTESFYVFRIKYYGYILLKKSKEIIKKLIGLSYGQ